MDDQEVQQKNLLDATLHCVGLEPARRGQPWLLDHGQVCSDDIEPGIKQKEDRIRGWSSKLNNKKYQMQNVL